MPKRMHTTTAVNTVTNKFSLVITSLPVHTDRQYIAHKKHAETVREYHRNRLEWELSASPQQFVM